MKNVEMVLIEAKDLDTLRRVVHWLYDEGNNKKDREEAARVLEEIACNALKFPVKEGVLPWAAYAHSLEEAAIALTEKYDERVPADIRAATRAMLCICARSAREVMPKVQMFQEAAEKAGLKVE